MENQRPRSEFTDVDHAQNPADYLRMLDAQRSMPFIQQYKQRVRMLLDLHPGHQVLDAGTGTGEDAQEAAKLVAPGGQAVGLDLSRISSDNSYLPEDKSMTTQQPHDESRRHKMITFDRENVRFTYRVAGVAIRDGKVLVQQPQHGGYYFLPGGRAELQEHARETLRREMQEELHVDVTVGRLLWVVENFFPFDGRDFHELGLYFLMTFPDDSLINDTNKTFALQEGRHEFVLLWHSLDDLSTVRIYPSFLQTALRSLPEVTEHVVHVDE